MYKVQVVHLDGSTFIELCGENQRENAEKEAEAVFRDMKEQGVSTLWVGLWEGNQVVDTFNGECWGREQLEF